MQFLTSAPNFRGGGGSATPLTRPSRAPGLRRSSVYRKRKRSL